MYSYGNFSASFFWSPLGNYEKKSCLNKLKFWEASRNQKRSICWKFQLSISLGTQKSPSTIQAWAKLNKPFYSESKVSSPEIRTFLGTLFICILTFSYVLNHWCEHPKFSLDFLLDFKDFIVSIFFCLWWAGSMIFSLRIFWASSSTSSFWLVWKN